MLLLQKRTFTLLILTILAIMISADLVSAQKSDHRLRSKTMNTTAKGNFEVKVTPVKDDETSAVDGIGRLAINKVWSGALNGTSKGQMLGSSDAAQTIGGYVAMEVFTGTLDGKKGTFSLQHNGTMEAGKFAINIEVVPGSGTGELKGIAGKMTLVIADGKHHYELEYALGK